MSQKRRDADFNDLDDTQFRRTRDGEGPRIPIGYKPGDGRVRIFPGDEKFPYFKSPPDVEGEFSLREIELLSPNGPLDPDAALPIVPTFETLAEIDVRGWCQLTLYIIYITGTTALGNGSGRLTILPEAAVTQPFPSNTSVQGGNNPTFFPIGVVDQALEIPGFQSGFARRNIFSAELTVDPFNGQANPPVLSTPTLMVFPFDVSTYTEFRFRVGELQNDVLSPGTQVALRYALQR